MSDQPVRLRRHYAAGVKVPVEDLKQLLMSGAACRDVAATYRLPLPAVQQIALSLPVPTRDTMGDETGEPACRWQGCRAVKTRARGLWPRHYQRWRRSGLPDTAETPVCEVPGCPATERKARGLCARHYFRWYRTGRTGAAVQTYGRRPGCAEPDCTRPHRAKGWCVRHYEEYVNPRRRD